MNHETEPRNPKPKKRNLKPETDMPGLDAFLVHARRMRDRYGVGHIFLSTDCADTARACDDLEEFHCTTLPLERSVYDVGAGDAPEHNPTESDYDQWIERRIQLGEVDGSEAALHAIAEVDTLASCHYLIGRLGTRTPSPPETHPLRLSIRTPKASTSN